MVFIERVKVGGGYDFFTLWVCFSESTVWTVDRRSFCVFLVLNVRYRSRVTFLTRSVRNCTRSLIGSYHFTRIKPLLGRLFTNSQTKHYVINFSITLFNTPI